MHATTGPRLSITRAQIISRGFKNRCPNCGNRSLFPPGSLRIREACPVCGLNLDPGGGFWLGPWVINYTVIVVFFVSPMLLLGVRDVLPLALAITLAVVCGAFVLPLLLYRCSWSWWLMIYFIFFPDKLPANEAG